ncbi:MAG: CARDB domain-containing protein [Patescibacteria group bacterium]
MADTPQSQNPGLLANILAVAGFIILIVIIVWGAYHLLRLTGTGVSSLFSRFSRSENAITITVPPSPVQSGSAATLEWTYEPKEAGTFAFLYQCKSGFRFDVKTPDNKSISIPCGSAFTVGDAKALSVIPMLSGTTTLEVPLSIVFMPSATTSTERPQGTAALTVTAGSAAAMIPSAPMGGAQTPAKPVGTPDLSVRILAIGVIDPTTNAFVNRYPMGPNDIAAVKFDIANNGGGATGTYSFTVQLPMSPVYTYTSPVQTSLTPGSHVENTLRFKPVQSGGGMITVTVDPTNAVRESNESNNITSQSIAIPSWSGTYQPYVY